MTTTIVGRCSRKHILTRKQGLSRKRIARNSEASLFRKIQAVGALVLISAFLTGNRVLSADWKENRSWWFLMAA